MIDGACEFARRMLSAFREAVDHEDTTPELAEILSTRTVDVEYRVESAVRVRE
jgi:methionine aminopeptidase